MGNDLQSMLSKVILGGTLSTDDKTYIHNVLQDLYCLHGKEGYFLVEKKLWSAPWPSQRRDEIMKSVQRVWYGICVD